MKQDKKLLLLLLPLIFVVLLVVPLLILDIVPRSYIQGMPDVIWGTYALILGTSMVIWCLFFYYIPTGVYIAILVVYTVVSWRWILKSKKGNVMYFIVWLVLCVLSILMYWKWGSEYCNLIRQ